MSDKTANRKKQRVTVEQVCFEEALGKLELIITTLEEGDLSLEAALEKFEEGINISRFCVKRLGEIEAKVDLLLVEEQGQTVSSPAVLGGEP
jgi:exodeoxyribonuclease VII small subunit